MRTSQSQQTRLKLELLFDEPGRSRRASLRRGDAGGIFSETKRCPSLPDSFVVRRRLRSWIDKSLFIARVVRAIERQREGEIFVAADGWQRTV
jgi:hypothetical protein